MFTSCQPIRTQTEKKKKKKKSKLSKARENAGDQVMIGVPFTLDWLGVWHEFSQPITEQSLAKTK